MSDLPIESTGSAAATPATVERVLEVQNQERSTKQECGMSMFQFRVPIAPNDSSTTAMPADPGSLMTVFPAGTGRSRSLSKRQEAAATPVPAPFFDPLYSPSGSVPLARIPAPSRIAKEPSHQPSSPPIIPPPLSPPMQSPSMPTITTSSIPPSLPRGGPIVLLSSNIPPPPGYVPLTSLGIPDPMHLMNPPAFGMQTTTVAPLPGAVHPKYYPPPRPIPVPAPVPAVIPVPAPQSISAPAPEAPVATQFNIPDAPTKPRALRRKLPADAKAILQGAWNVLSTIVPFSTTHVFLTSEFCNGMTGRPTWDEIEALRLRVAAIPGAEWYDRKALNKHIGDKLRVKKRASVENMPMKIADGEMGSEEVDSKEGVMNAWSGSANSQHKAKATSSKSASDRFCKTAPI